MSEKRQTDQVSINIFDLIDSICGEFRRHWKAGKRPRIEDYLLRVPEDARSNLFKNILLLDIRYRQRAGETPRSKDYVGRFPEFRRLIGDAFLESTSMSMEALEGTPDSSSAEFAPTVDMPAANRIGDYELIRELGRGGFGVVYEARHIERGNRVALKTLPTGVNGQEVNADRLHRFRREFRSLAEINHPNLVGMQTLEVDGSQWFFTMDLIDGEDFLSFVRPGGKLDESRLRGVLGQMAGAIMSLHQRGIVHRDLKPSNVMVDHDGKVAILDFGLVAQMRKATDVTATKSGMFAGTPRYAAPEQMFGERTEASDWYALGIMLYEALTGDPPFTETNQMELLRQKQETDPPRLSGRNDLPTDLAELVDRFIRRAPSERLGLQAITELVSLDPTTGSKDSTATAGSIDLEGVWPDGQREGETLLVGRDEQLSELHRIGESFLATKTAQTVMVSGRSGEGKSSLVEAFLSPYRMGSDVVVFTGRCYERESVPFKAVDCWIDPLVSFLRSKSELWLKQRLPADITGLSQIFPVLRRVETIRQMPSIDNTLMTAEKLRHRAFGALRDLMVAISEETPVMIFVDDLQWGDADSVAAFDRMFATPDPPTLLLVGSFRSDEQESSPFLREWRSFDRAVGTESIEVGPLTPGQARELVDKLLPEEEHVADQQIDRIYNESAGNPYFLAQLIESYDAVTKRFRPVPLHDLIENRLLRLPTESRLLLEMLAVSGHDLPVSQVGLLAGSNSDPYAILTRMRNERLVRLWGSGEDQRVDTYHDKIRETVMGDLADDTRRGWHLQIAETLEQHAETAGKTFKDFPPEDPFDRTLDKESIPWLFDLAKHFHAAEEPRGLDYQLLAGEESLRLYSNQEAIVYFSNAETLIKESTHDDARFRVLCGLGWARIRCQQLELAIDSLVKATESDTDVMQRVEVSYALMVAHGNLGLTRKAVEYFEQATDELGMARPKSTWGCVLRIPVNTAGILLYRIVTSVRSTPEKKHRAKCEATLMHHVTISILEVDLFRTIDVAFRSCVARYAIDDPIQTEIAHALAGEYFNGTGLLRLGRLAVSRLNKESWSKNSLDDVKANLYRSYAAALYYAGQLREALPNYQASFDLAVRLGENRYTIESAHFIRHTLMWIGDANSERAAGEQVIRSAQNIGDTKGRFWGQYDTADALARGGLLSLAAEHMLNALQQLGPERWYCSEPIFGGARGFFLMQCSERRHARAVLAEAWEIARSKRMFLEYSLRCLPVLLESVVGHNWLDPLSREDLREARRLVRWHHVLHRNYPPLQSGMLRSLGRLAASRGKARKARRYFQRSAQVAESRGMPYYHARALLDLAAVQEEGRKENRSQAIKQLKEMASVIPRAEGWLFGDQYDEAVVAPDFDLEAWEQEHGMISLPARDKSAND